MSFKITVRKVSHRNGLPFAAFINYTPIDGSRSQIGCFHGATRAEAEANATRWAIAADCQAETDNVVCDAGERACQ